MAEGDVIYEIDVRHTPEEVAGRHVIVVLVNPVTEREDGAGKWEDTHTHLGFDSRDEAEEKVEDVRKTFPNASILET